MVGEASHVTPTLRARAVTDAGRERSLNEDAALLVPLPTGGLFAVADGMGGHAAGEVASQLALEELRDAFELAEGNTPSRLVRALQAANGAVHSQAVGNQAGMGTTLAAVLIDGGVALVANVGDSRVYLWRGRELRQLSRDHSWVAEQVRKGFLTEQEGRSHAWRNVVSNAMGSEAALSLDLFGIPLERGDRFLICSDGVTDVLSDEQLAELLAREDDLGILLPDLVKLANDHGGPDNITAIVIDVTTLLAKPRYTLPVLHPNGPVAAATLARATKRSSAAYVTLAVLYLTLLGMIVLPEYRNLIALIGGGGLAVLLFSTVRARRPRKGRGATRSTADISLQENSDEATRLHP
ncbi:protein phosphatase [Deinococcus yavapaiensis KR-236]|uniref:Protein phosphatase n=2 Tax=Deinococcus TaxID=1298 RepID=A0A318S4C5_9DEIO|nr:protein phosphatase [Deinococcus yavapaiensis KR-236]